MRTSLVVTIVAIGALGLALALASGAFYRDEVYAEHRAVLAEQLRHGVQDLRRHYESEAQLAAMWLVSEPGWSAAWQRRDAHELARRLTALKQRLTERDPTLAGLAVLDAHAQLLTPPATVGGCAPRSASQTAPAGATICLDDGRIYYVLRAPLPGEAAPAPSLARSPPASPIGEPTSAGQLEFVADFVLGVRRLEATYGLMLRLGAGDGRVFYQSPHWAQQHVPGAELPLTVHLPARQRLALEAYGDVQAIETRLTRIHYAVVVVATLVLIAGSYIALALLERTALTPLRALGERLRGIRQDKSHLGQKVVVSGNSEVVELAAGFNEMTAQLKELYGSLEHMAFTDALTGLPNRVLFHDRLQQLILAARRDHRPFALFIMDLDRFKDINDTLGHHVGDVLLQQVATRLRAKLRESDTVARMGGDEFAVLLPGANGKHAAMAARMLLQALRLPFDAEGHRLDIGASIGIALYPDHGVDATLLVQRADVAMYSAKQNGSGHAFYDTRLDQHSSSRLVLMGELRRAVEEEQFELHYQPKIDLGTSRVMGVEALVRWRHPRDGLVYPDAFIQLLEQSGLIKSLTPWMLNEAMTMSRYLQEQGLVVTMSVNLSVRDLQDTNLTDTLAEQLAAHQVDPAMLELEVTESAVMTEPERALAALGRLAEMGFRLAIDDFGTGYSSFAYLKKMPVNTLKIDKSFVSGMMRDDNDAAIVRTSVELAHNLNIKIVAEGVEDAETLEQLRQLGCDAAQGLHISRPLPAAELMAWMRQSSWGLRDTPVKLSLV